MTVFRLATATVLLAGLALPVLAQGTATPALAVPGTGAVTRGMTAPVAPTATLPVTVPAQAVMPGAVMPGAVTPGAMTTRSMPTQASVTPGAGDATMPRVAPVATPSVPHAEAGTVEARPARTDATHAARTERRSHHRFALATRMERTRMSHGQPVAGDAAPDATR